MDALAVIDGSVWTLGSCRSQYDVMNRSKIIVKYKYYLSKIEDNLGNRIVWEKNMHRHHLLEGKPNKRESLKFLSPEESVSSFKDVSIPFKMDQKETIFPRVLGVAFRNAPEKEKPVLRRTWNVSMKEQTDISNMKLAYDDIGELEQKIFATSKNTYDSVGFKKHLGSVPITDKFGSESVRQLSGDEQMVVKYKYLLSHKKDVMGNPIQWFENNEKQNTTITDDFLFMEYKQMSPFTECHEASDMGKLLGQYDVKSRETTLFSHQSIQTDDDFRQLTGADQTEVNKNNIMHKPGSNWSMSSGYQSGRNLSSVVDQSFASDTIETQVNEEVFEDTIITSTPVKYGTKRSSPTYTENDITYAETPKYYSVRKREKVTFTAMLGSIPYRAVFRLDDDIRHLKTFIHLISGLPAYRQKYSFGALAETTDEYQGKASKKKVKIVRDLGLSDGQKINLGIVDV